MSMTHPEAWHLVDGVYWQALDMGFECAERWSQDGDQNGHFTGHVDLGTAGHLAWDSRTGWTHHALNGTEEGIAEADAGPHEVVMALDLPEA